MEKPNVIATYKKNEKQLEVTSRYFQFAVRSLNALFITNYFIYFK